MDRIISSVVSMITPAIYKNSGSLHHGRYVTSIKFD